MSENVVSAIRERLGSKLLDVNVHSPRRVYLDIRAEDLTEVAAELFDGMGARYAIASGMQTADGFEVLHHFAFDSDHVVVSVRVRSGPDAGPWGSVPGDVP